MRWHRLLPDKATLVRHFKAAKLRLTTQRKAVAGLPDTRIVTATEELNRIVDDIRDAPGAPKAPQLTVREPPSLVIHTVGKILRGLKIDR